jgi:ornithine carbamoyltransferase
MNHFLDLDLLSPETLSLILNAALKEKRDRDFSKAAALAGKSLALVFEKNSTRTRISFQAAMQQLGGQSFVLDAGTSQLGRGETIADTARVLSRYVDAIMLRTDGHDKLEEMARFASVPVINGLTDKSHPCQIMADLMTVQEHFGSLKDKRVVWLGDGNNVAVSWVQAAVAFGIPMTVSTPASMQIPQEVQDWLANQGGHQISFSEDPDAVAGADVVIADTWVSMGDEAEAEQRLTTLAPYQVNEACMKKASSTAVFLHCLPAHRGEEVTDAVIDGPQSLVFDEAENRMHVQKAILLWCFGLLGDA